MTYQLPIARYLSNNAVIEISKFNSAPFPENLAVRYRIRVRTYLGEVLKQQF